MTAHSLAIGAMGAESKLAGRPTIAISWEVALHLRAGRAEARIVTVPVPVGFAWRSVVRTPGQADNSTSSPGASAAGPEMINDRPMLVAGAAIPSFVQFEIHRQLTDLALERRDVRRRFDRLFLALEVERQLTGVVLLQPRVHHRVIDAGLSGETFQAAFARKVRLYDPKLELGADPSVRLAARKSSAGLPPRSNPALLSVQPVGLTPPEGRTVGSPKFLYLRAPATR